MTFLVVTETRLSNARFLTTRNVTPHIPSMPITASGNAIAALVTLLRAACTTGSKEWKVAHVRRLDANQLRFLEETSRDYEMALMEDPRALSYLDGRGVSMASRDRFRLGLVVDPPPEHAKMRGRLAIPTLKRAGVTGFKFRCLRPECLEIGWCEGHGRYMTYEPQAMYNVAALDTDAGYIAICEGELDALILDGECDIPSIALPGVNSWESHAYWRRLLKDFNRIWIFADNDSNKEKNVGHEFAEFLREKLPQSVIVELPAEAGKKSDVNTVFLSQGRQFLRELIGLK